MDKPILRLWLQTQGQGLHPVSRRILTTARALGKNYVTQAVVFSPAPLAGLEDTGVDQVLNFVGPSAAGFLPELQAGRLAGLPPAEILLFPATPEGRTLSAMTAAILHTGSTADCTSLSLTEEGALLQTRPAFSGSRMADILTDTRPQIASLRFGMPVPERTGKAAVTRIPMEEAPPYAVRWVERTAPASGTEGRILAVGGGLREQGQLALLRSLAEKLGACFCCSRALVERGWMPRSAQIGLSGRTLSGGLLLAFGISGSVQFQAGLESIGKLIAVDINPDTALMARADLPIQGDMISIAEAMLKRL